MAIGRLDINTTQAKIEFSSQYARVDMHQPQPHLSITRQKGGIDVETQHPQLIIDSSACRSEEGEKTTSELISDYAQQGMQDVTDAASQITQDGLYILKNFHSDKNIIADIARSKALPQPKQMVLRFIPSQPPQVSFTDNVFDMNVRPDSIEFNWDVSSHADVEVVQTGGVDIRMAQYPQIQINYIAPSALDTSA